MLYIDITWRNDIPEYLRLWTRISPVCPFVTQTSPQRVDAPYSRRTHSGNGPLTGRGRTRTRASIQSRQTESETMSVVTRQCRQMCSGVGTKSTLRGDLKPEELNRRDFWRGAINPYPPGRAGERCKLPQWGPSRRPGCQELWCMLGSSGVCN